MELIRSNSKYIYSPIDKKMNYDGLLDRLNKALTGSPLRFARRATMLDAYAWHTTDTGWYPLSEATAEERAEVERILSAARPLVATAMAEEPEAEAIVEQVFTVPDAEAFINFRTGDGGIQVAMAGWGFKTTGHPGIAAKWVLPSRPRRNQVCACIGFRRYGEALPNQPFRIETPGGGKDFVTGADGLFTLPPLAPGQTKKIMVEDKVFTLTISEGMGTAWFDLKEEVAPPPPPPELYEADLCVVDTLGMSCPGQEVSLVRNGETVCYVTDGQGRARLTGFTNGEAFRAYLTGQPEVCSDFAFSPEIPAYYLTLPDQEILPPDADLLLHVLDADDTPIAGATVQYTAAGRQPLAAVTDTEGRILIPASTVTDSSPVTLTLRQGDRRFEPTAFIPTADEREYTLRVHPLRTGGRRWLWIVAGILFFLLAALGLFLLFMWAGDFGWWKP